ncbi:MAG: hypothetical protein ABJN84_10570 [Flavobacteriaceae bacterium]
MDYLNHTTESLPAEKHAYYLERSRHAILNLGYEFVVFKSKAKKSFIRLKNKGLRLS